jgi:hypothetical protein
VEECTYFWGVNTSWGINTAESKDLYIRKIIRLHNQHKELQKYFQIHQADNKKLNRAKDK